MLLLQLYLVTVGALKTAADRATVNAHHVHGVEDRVTGDQHATGKGRENTGSMSSGGKAGIEDNYQNPAEGELQKIPGRSYDKAVAAQTSRNEKAGHKNGLKENSTGKIVEDDKRGDMNKNGGE